MGTSTKTKIDGITLRDIVEAEEALEMLANRPMEGKVGYRIAKVLRKIKPDLKDYRKSVGDLIEANGGIPADRGGIKLDVKSKTFMQARKKLDKHNESVLAEPVVIEGGVGPIKLNELLEALPRRKTGEGDDAKEELAFIEPIILANLWWLIEE